MDLFIFFIELVAVFIEALAIYFYFNRSLGNNNRRVHPAILLSIIFTTLTIIYHIPALQSNYLMGSIVHMLFVYSYSLLYTGSHHKKILYAVGFVSIILSMSPITTIILHATHMDVSSTLGYIIKTIGSRIVVLFFAFFIPFLFSRKKSLQLYFANIGWGVCQVIGFIILLQLSSIEIEAVDDAFLPLILLCGLLIIAMNIFFGYSISRLERAHMYEHMNQKLMHKIESQEYAYQQIEHEYKLNRAYLHDANKHLNAILFMLTNKEEARAIDYIQHITREVYTEAKYPNTGILVIDALINHFYARCKENQITIKHKFQVDPNTLCIDEQALAIVLGNLLDNAFNATLTLEDSTLREVTIGIIQNDHLTIMIENTYDNIKIPSIVKGIGLTNVDILTRRCHAVWEIKQQEDNTCQALVSFPLMR